MNANNLQPTKTVYTLKLIKMREKKGKKATFVVGYKLCKRKNTHFTENVYTE